MTNTDGHTPQNEWDERWVRIREMEVGSDDPLPEFEEEVRSAMADLGNEVGRPLVMKVSVEVYGGDLNRQGSEEDG